MLVFYLVLYGFGGLGLLFVVFLSGVLLVCFVFVWLGFRWVLFSLGGLGLLVCRSVVVGIIYSRRVLFWVCSSLRFQRFACGVCVGVC